MSSPTGSPEATLAAAAERLNALGRVAGKSSIYSTAPVGFADQPRFLNAVVALETKLEPRALLERLLAIEKEFGRDRSAGIRNGPRTLDLDILVYGNRLIHEPGLEIPHPRLGERAFVLIPLCELEPDLMDVTQCKSVTQLLDTLRKEFSDQDDSVHAFEIDIRRVGGFLDPVDPDESTRANAGGADADR